MSPLLNQEENPIVIKNINTPEKPKVLIVDPHVNTCASLSALFENQLTAEIITDPNEALRKALDWNPELILSETHLPGFDGFALLKTLKNNFSTRHTPFIFLSSRSDEDARVEGIEAGADDYISKSISERELLARMKNLVSISRARSRTEKEFYSLFLQSPAHIHVMRGPEHVLEFFHPLAIPFTGKDITGMKIREAMPQVEGQGFFEMLDNVYQTGTPVQMKEAKAVLPDAHGKEKEYYFNINYLPWRDPNGDIQGVLQFTIEVTDTVRQRLKAEASEQNLRAIAQQAPVAIGVLNGPYHHIQIVNESLLKIWGRKEEEVINMPIATALPEITNQGYIEILNEVYRTGNPYVANERMAELMRNNILEKRYLNFIYEPLLGSDKNIEGIIMVAVDVTEQVVSRKIIDEIRANLENAVELAELGTWTMDLKTMMITISPRIKEWWGLPALTVHMDEAFKAMHPDDILHVSNAVTHAIEVTGFYDTEYRLIHPVTGEISFMHANGKVFYENGQPALMHGVVRNLTIFKTTQKELEKQVIIRTEELVKLNSDLLRNNENLRQFAYVASHDLQEPLRKIMTFSDIIKTKLNEKIQVEKYLTKINTSAGRMSALIQDVLMYSQVSKETIQNEKVDLNKVLQDVTDDFELLITQKKANIKSDHLPIVSGNKLHFYQLFNNLIGNSLKFCKNIPLIQIRHTITNGKEFSEINPTILYNKFEFQDNGIGFDPEYAEKIFGLFSRLHNTQDFAGTGIGLALCKKIIENHHGHILARSKKGEGATFSIYLPVSAEEQLSLN